MKNVQIYLKGWRDSELYSDAVNDARHELHAEAISARVSSFMPYEAGDLMYLAFEYQDDNNDTDDLVVCERAFQWFNVGDNPISRQYRAAGNRSLSVGDVVVVDGEAYAVDRFGWHHIFDFKPTLTER